MSPSIIRLILATLSTNYSFPLLPLPTGESYTVSFSDDTIGMFGSTAGTWTGVTGLDCSVNAAVSQTGRIGSSS